MNEPMRPRQHDATRAEVRRGARGGERTETIRLGDRVTVRIPRGSALGQLCDDEGLSRTRRATVLDPKASPELQPLLRFAVLGDHEVPRAWLR